MIGELKDRRAFLPAMVAVGFFLLFFYPVQDWDARSIWLFHAKRMFYDGDIASRLDHYAPIIKPTYPDYIPAIHASVARLAGVWNELLPKTGTFIAILPPLFLILDRVRLVSVRLFLLGGILFVLGIQLLSGYMDAPLALYTVASIALLQEARDSGNDWRALACVAVLLAALAATKEEGLPIAAILTVLWLQLVLKPSSSPHRIKLILLFVCALMPVIAWHAMIASSDIQSEVMKGGWVTRAVGRVKSGEAALLKRTLWYALSKSAVLILFVAYIRRRLEPYVAWFFVSYAAVLALVYLGTPFNLEWHLGTSIQRVTLVFMLLAVVVAAYETEAWAQSRTALKDRHGPLDKATLGESVI